MSATDPFGFEGLAEMVGDASEAPKLRVVIDRLARRVRVLEEKQRAVIDLCRDPAESHRMITRKEIMRLLRDDEPLEVNAST